jgi:26S proteasome regulatory subunit N5
MVELDEHEEAFLETCKHHKAIYNTKSVKDDKMKRELHLKSAILYLLLAAHDPEQSDLLIRMESDEGMEELPFYKLVQVPSLKFQKNANVMDFP